MRTPDELPLARPTSWVEPITRRPSAKTAASANGGYDTFRITLRKYAKGWTWVLWGALIALLGAAIGVMNSPRGFVAEGSFVVTLGREFRYKSSDPSAERTSMFRLAEAVNSEVELLESRGLAERVLSDLTVESVYPDLIKEDEPASRVQTFERAINAFREDMTVIPVPDSSIVRLSFPHLDPSIAAKVVNSSIESLIDLHLEIFGEDRADVLEERVASLEERLRELRKQLGEQRVASGVFDADRQVSERVLELSALEIELEHVRARHKELLTALESEDNGKILSSGLVGDSENLDEIRSELLRLELQEQSLLANYREDSRQVAGIRRSREAVQKFMADSLRTESNGLEARANLLAQHLTELTASITTLEQKGQVISELEQEIELLELRLNQQRSVLEEARLSVDLDERKSASVRLLDPASVPVEAKGIAPAIRLLSGLLVGAFLGAMSWIGWTGLRSRWS